MLYSKSVRAVRNTPPSPEPSSENATAMHRLHLLRSLGRRNPKPSPPPHAADLPAPVPRSLHKLSNGSATATNDCRRRFSSFNHRDDIALEEDVERKAGWLLKFIFLGTGGAVAYQFFPFMGDSLLQQSISLLHVKDPLFKRMGSSRLTRFAIDDERRMKIVEMGGAHKLLNVLEDAKDDKTRKEALKALFALSHAVEAVEALHQAGAIAIINATPNSVEHAEIETFKAKLLERFQELKHA